MFAALATAVAVGVVVAVLTETGARLRIADERRLAVLVCLSGAIAGWALVDTIAGLGTDTLDAWDVAGATAGAVLLAAAAWRGRRRPIEDLELSR